MLIFTQNYTDVKHFCESYTKLVDKLALPCYFSIDKPVFAAVSGTNAKTGRSRFLRQERLNHYDKIL